MQLSHLHVHSEYSLSDGAIRIKDLIAKVKSFGHKAVALTDHANLFGVVEFYEQAHKEGIKPIVGCEMYHSLKYQAVMLCKNNDGYKNLVRIVSKGYEDTSFLPAVELDSLCGEGIVFIDSFHGGCFSDLVLSGASDHEIKSYIELLKEKFDHVYIEICANGFPNEKDSIEKIISKAKAFGLPIVASANAHYLEPEDKEAHTILIGIKNEIKLRDIGDRRRDIKSHLFTNEEMLDAYGEWPESLENISTIADMCEVTFTFGKFYLPKISTQAESTDLELIDLSKKGLKSRLEYIQKLRPLSQDDIKTYEDRLQMEIEVITKMGFSDYFLIVADFISWAKSKDIPVGPGRGSGAGSLVAFSLQITNIDPLPYNLIFERFLNPDRISMPDFDIDFCQERRDEVIKYVSERYGQNQVAQITTFGKMLAKAVVRDVGRVMGMSYTRVDAVAKLIPNELGIKLSDAIEREPELHKLVKTDDFIKDLITMSLKLEGLCRHTSVHAAGVVISDGPMSDYVPVYKDENGSLITQFEMKNAEKVGLVKFDFLGLKTLTVIQKTIKTLAKTRGIELDIDSIPLADKKVYDLISSSRSIGIFQLESTGMQNLLKKLLPSCFEDVIALVALFRPGPLGSGMVDEFVERKHGRQKITYQLPQLEPILKDTYGIILYQEQVQKIAASLASYSLGEADLLRRAMGKKKPEEMAKQKTRFIEGCLKNKIDETLSSEIFDLMAKFAEYGFNKSHSAAYGLVSYQTAFLKTHYPAEFFAASMSCDKDNTDKIVRYIWDAKSFHIKILPPCINHSYVEFHVESKKSVRFALSAIKGLGGGVVKMLVDERLSGGKFESFADLASRVDLAKFGKKNLETLVNTGALDVFGVARTQLLLSISDLVGFSSDLHTSSKLGQGQLFGDVVYEIPLKPYTPQPLGELLKEKKLLGTFLSYHPTQIFKTDSDKFSNAMISELEQCGGQSDISILGVLTDCFIRTTRDNKKIQILRIEDEFAQFSPAMFFDGDPPILPPLDTLVICKLSVSKSYGNNPVRIKLQSIKSLEEHRAENIKSVKLRMGAESWKNHKEMIAKNDGMTPLSLEISYPQAKINFESHKCYIELNDDVVSRLDRQLTYS